MKILINEEKLIELKEVYNPIVLNAEKGEKISICMRDGGFELRYNSKLYIIHHGEVNEIKEYFKNEF